MNNMTASEVPQPSEIELILGRIEANVSVMHLTIAGIEKRLGSVLSPHIEEESPESTLLPCVSELGKRLKGTETQLDYANMRLGELSRRIVL